MQNTSSISFGNNGQTLNFASLTLVDEQYYSCGILTINNVYTAINSFFLYVRGILIYFLFIYLNSERPLMLLRDMGGILMLKQFRKFSISNKKILKKKLTL